MDHHQAIRLLHIRGQLGKKLVGGERNRAVIAFRRLTVHTETVNMTAVKKIEDQGLLTKLAMDSPTEDIGMAAVRNMSDQALLAKVAIEARFEEVGVAAAKKPKDQTLLAKVAMTTGGHPKVNISAFEKLTDRALLAKVAVEEDQANDVRDAARKRIGSKAP